VTFTVSATLLFAGLSQRRRTVSPREIAAGFTVQVCAVVVDTVTTDAVIAAKKTAAIVRTGRVCGRFTILER
jgi:hypothetical protein